MELYFLDDSFNVLAGPLDELTSVVWKVRYFETGTFTLHFPRNLLSKVNGAVYVRTGDNDGPIRCGRIEYLETSDDGGCEIGGHLLEILLADRVISGKRTYQGSLTDAVLAAVRENLNNQIITIGDCALISDNVTVSSEWDNLADWLYSILKPHGASFTVTLDPDTLLPVFRLVKGLDRSTDFCEAEPAIFSSSFGNIVSISLTKQNESMKNVAYIEGSDGTVVTADNSGGAQIREIYKKAADISPDDFEDTAAYENALLRRGLELLAKYPESVFVSAECDTDALPIFGIDYNIGDVCDVVDDELCLSFALRLTAVDIVYENGGKTVCPFFGEEVSAVRRLLKNQNI